MAWYKSGKKSHQNPLESQPKCKAHSGRQSPPRSSAPRSMTARKHVLSSASWERDGSDSLEAASHVPPWRVLVKIGTGKVEVNWGVVVFPRSNWELNVTLELGLSQSRGCCKPPLPQGDVPGALLPSGPTCPSSQHQQPLFPLVFQCQRMLLLGFQTQLNGEETLRGVHGFGSSPC